MQFVDGKAVVSIALVRCCCGVCGIEFAIPEELNKKRMGDRGDFWCPNGHRLHYGWNALEAAQKQLIRTQQQLDQARAYARCQREQKEKTQRQLTATKGVVTRVKNRVKNGLCPCCNRYFSNLHQHMHTKHPGYQPKETEHNDR